MKCIILAAGYATRLYPLTKNFPKPLLQIAGKPIIKHLIEDIYTCDDNVEFIIVSNHKFVKHFKQWLTKEKRFIQPQYNITIIDDGTTTNETRLGAVKDIQLAVHKYNIKEDCLVIAGDNLLDFELYSFVQYAKQKKTSCIMSMEEHDHTKLTKTGVLEVKDDLVINMEEKPDNPKSNYVCPPFYYYTAKDIAKVDEALADDCDYDAPGSFLVWLCHKSPVHVFEMPGHRYDIGDLKSYEAAKKHFEQGE